MTNKESGIFVNSLSLFLLSFLSIKAILIWFKLVIAKLFGIQTTLYQFTLWGVSNSNSGVWNYKSVLSFYSIELFLLIALIIATFFLNKAAKRKSGFKKHILFWFHISSILALLSLLSAGILTRNNIFHFLNWMHIPYSVSLIIGFASIFIAFILGIVFNVQFMKHRPSNLHKRMRSYFSFVRMYGIVALFPAVIGLLLLYLPHIKSITKYDKVELFTLLLFFTSGTLFLGRSREKRRASESVTTLNFPILIIAGALYLGFLIVKFI